MLVTIKLYVWRRNENNMKGRATTNNSLQIHVKQLYISILHQKHLLERLQYELFGFLSLSSELNFGIAIAKIFYHPLVVFTHPQCMHVFE